jgi:hypothetical protein
MPCLETMIELHVQPILHLLDELKQETRFNAQSARSFLHDWSRRDLEPFPRPIRCSLYDFVLSYALLRHTNAEQWTFDDIEQVLLHK